MRLNISPCILYLSTIWRCVVALSYDIWWTGG